MLSLIVLFFMNPAFASVTVNVNGTSHTIPQTNEKGWGTNVTAWIQAISQYTLQPSGGTFTMNAETDFGPTYGFKIPYIKTETSNPATAGLIRLAKTDVIDWRNNANGGNVSLGIDTSDNLTFQSTKILLTGAIVNADVNASAAIAYSKLASLTSAHILVGSAGNVATDTAVTGDVSITNGGVTAYATTVPIAKGGTNNASLGVDAGGIVYTDGTKLVNLSHGSSGTVLTSGGTGAPTWSSPLVSPFTTKGDLITNADGATAARLGVGSNYQVLTANSAATNGIDYETISAPYEIRNCTIAASVASSALTVALKDNAGSDPSATSLCKIGFRNATATTGTYSEVTVSAATSVVLSNGSALGCTASSICQVYVYAINNAGTVVLGIINGSVLDEGSVNTSTVLAGSGADDNGDTLYSTAAQANKAIRLIGRVTITPAAAFAWTNAPTEISNWPFPNTYTVAAHASGATTSIAGTTTVVINGTKDYDTTNGGYSVSTGLFTVPNNAGGKYRITAFLRFAAFASWASGNVVEVYSMKNSSQVQIMTRALLQTTQNAIFAVNGTDLVDAKGGDTLGVNALQTNGSNRAVDSSSWVSFERVGN